MEVANVAASSSASISSPGSSDFRPSTGETSDNVWTETSGPSPDNAPTTDLPSPSHGTETAESQVAKFTENKEVKDDDVSAGRTWCQQRHLLNFHPSNSFHFPGAISKSVTCNRNKKSRKLLSYAVVTDFAEKKKQLPDQVPDSQLSNLKFLISFFWQLSV